MLDLDTLDSQFSQIVGAADGSVSPATRLAAAYDSYAKGAEIAGATCAAGGDLSLLIEAFGTDNTDASITRMASKLCAYWAGVPQIGTPAHGGTSVVSVVAAFDEYSSALESTIRSMITATLFEKPYKRFFGAVESVLKTVPILVSEMMPTSPPSPQTFTEFML